MQQILDAGPLAADGTAPTLKIGSR